MHILPKLYIIFPVFFILIIEDIHTQNVSTFAEYGTTIHTGKHTPMWQNSNQHGLSSIKNNTYIRGAAFYNKNFHSWQLKAGADFAVAAGFTSTFIIQQAYADIRYKWFGLWAGNKEIDSSLLNQQLSSGGLTWSGNARPIPQIAIGIFDYVRIAPKVQLKAELSYGWFTDTKYQEKHVGDEHSYTRKIKYHHKSFFLRFGKPEGKWLFDIGMSLDAQFGGYKVRGRDEGDLGNGWKDYWNVLIPQSGGDDSPGGEQVWYQGNYMGSEHVKLTYKHNNFFLSAYLENYYDDFSGMGKQNGLDGLWGIEFKINRPLVINNIVIEYYQTTNQSGPLHGLDDSIVEKTGGADDYYNNDWYPGWVHWGMGMGNPLVASPIYNNNGHLAFQYNRIKAIHLGWSGDISNEWTYRAKLSFNRTWGTPFKPIPEILENFSTFAEFKYIPNKWKGWSFTASAAFDIGDIYGDNLGLQLKVHKKF